MNDLKLIEDVLLGDVAGLDAREELNNGLDDLEEMIRDNTKQALEALQRVKARMEWQPISTAPKDGVPVLMYRTGHTFVGYYGGANSGWRYNVSARDSVYPLPTHWKHLDEPPRGEE